MDTMVLEPIKDFISTMYDSWTLYTVAKPRAEIGKTKFKEEYERKLKNLAKELQEKQHKIIEEAETLDEEYERLDRLLDRYIKKFSNLQHRYLQKVEKLKERRQKKKFKKEVV